jgi:hypothetical protein
MAKISIEDMQLASEWLRANDGDGGEAEAMERVAAWLDEEVKKRELAQGVRAAVAKYGVSPARAREVLKRKLGAAS